MKRAFHWFILFYQNGKTVIQAAPWLFRAQQLFKQNETASQWDRGLHTSLSSAAKAAEAARPTTAASKTKEGWKECLYN